MKVMKVVLIGTLLWVPGLVLTSQAAPKTQAQINRERAQLKGAQREAAAERKANERAAWLRTQENRADQRDTARRHRNDKHLGDDIGRNAEEARDTLHDTGRTIRDWFGW